MLLNRNKKIWFCENPGMGQPVWLPLSVGIFERKMSRKSDKTLFFELGKEESPREDFTTNVKCISLRGHVEDSDEALMKILQMNGSRVGILQADKEKNHYNNAVYCEASVAVEEYGSGAANEPQGFEIQLNCGPEKHGIITNSVKGIAFTCD